MYAWRWPPSGRRQAAYSSAHCSFSRTTALADNAVVCPTSSPKTGFQRDRQHPPRPLAYEPFQTLAHLSGQLDRSSLRLSCCHAASSGCPPLEVVWLC